ncbi:MAG: nucleotidyltransferase domain-containing protein [Syntrophales bacterium]|nr:nucleotidyltransferase domain-containing protein [Syntrophales bacterium]
MDEVLERAVRIIVEVADPDRIILFGSRSRGNENRESDFDVCVIKRGVFHKRKLAQQIYRSLHGIGAPVDIIVETPEKLEELKSNPYMIYKDIVEQGSVLYDKSASD